MEQSKVVIKKIELHGFGSFAEHRIFHFDPHVNIIHGPNSPVQLDSWSESTENWWLVRAIAFMFDRSYENSKVAMRCLCPKFNHNGSVIPYVRITVETASGIYVKKKLKKEFNVTRLLKQSDIRYVFFTADRRHDTTIVDFHERIFDEFIVITEPMVDLDTAPDGYDLMLSLRNAFGLVSAKELINVKADIMRDLGTTEIVQDAQQRHDEEKAFLKKACTTELVFVEQQILSNEEKKRKCVERYPHLTQDDLRRQCANDTKKLQNKKQAIVMLGNYRVKCDIFNAMLRTNREKLTQALNESAEDLENEKKSNDELDVNRLIPKLNFLVARCRRMQLFKTKREVHMRRIKTLERLGIRAEIVENVDQRNGVIAFLEEQLAIYENLMSGKGWKGFDSIQKDYDFWLAKEKELYDSHETVRREFIEHFPEKYAAMIEILPKEADLLRLNGEMLQSRLKMIDLLSDHPEFMNNAATIGFIFGMEVLSDPATDPQLLNDFAGNVLDFVQLDKFDELSIQFVVPAISDALPAFVFKHKRFARDFEALIKKKAAGCGWYTIRFVSDESYTQADTAIDAPRGFKSLSAMLLSDDERRQNRAVAAVFAEFLVSNGKNVLKKPEMLAQQLKKTLIFPETKCFYTSYHLRVWMHNGTGDGFKDFLNSWHAEMRPEREKWLQISRGASQLHADIVRLKSDPKVEPIEADFEMLCSLQKAQIDVCKRIHINFREIIKEYSNLCRDQINRMCRIDIQRLKLMILKNGDLTDEAVEAGANEMLETIGNEDEKLAGGFANDIPSHRWEINRCAFPEQKRAYTDFIANCHPREVEHLPAADNEVDRDPEAQRKYETFVELIGLDKLLLVCNTRLAELTHANHRELIDADLLAEIRALPDQEFYVRVEQLRAECAEKKIVLPNVGTAYVNKMRKRSAAIATAREGNRKSISAYDWQLELKTSFEQNTFGHIFGTLISIVQKIDDLGLSPIDERRLALDPDEHFLIDPNRPAFAIRFHSARDESKEWILHRDTNWADIQMEFDDLVEGPLQMTFVFIDRVTKAIHLGRLLKMNIGTFAALFYLYLGLELNENLLILNRSIGSFSSEDMMFVAPKFGHRTDEQGECRQIFYVPVPGSNNAEILFPNDTCKIIDFN